jgi:nucleoside-diphosphate-sugar epimerase
LNPSEIFPSTILVTGASGLLGYEIVQALSKDKVNVIATYYKNKPDFAFQNVELVQLNILDTVHLLQLLKNCSHVIHCAAVVSFSRYKKKVMFETNVLGTRNLVDCLLNYKNIKLVHISSVAALGRNEKNIICEDTKWNDGIIHTFYAKTKYLAELEVFRGIEEGLNATILNPSVILAPSYRDRSSSKLLNYVKKRNLFYPKGYLNAVDARDVAMAAIKALTLDTQEKRIILNGFRISYKVFFEEIAKRLSVPPPRFQTNQFINTLAWIVDSLASFITGKEPFITKDALQLSGKDYVYHSKNLNLLGITFRKMNETLDWCCQKP